MDNALLPPPPVIDDDLKSETLHPADAVQWFVMRDLKRPNAKLPAYKYLKELGLEIFTPMMTKLVARKRKREIVEVPFMQDLLFVHASRRILDPIVDRISTLQYRFLRDGLRSPMTVGEAEMNRFIAATTGGAVTYYSPDSITPDMIGKKVRIIGGQLDGYVGHLQKLQGSKKKRLFVELPNVLTLTVEVQSEFIEILK